MNTFYLYILVVNQEYLSTISYFLLNFQLINKYLSSTYYMPSTLLGPEDTVVNQT